MLRASISNPNPNPNPKSAMEIKIFLHLVGYCFLLSSSNSFLEYEYYRRSCPQADQIIRSTLGRIYDQNPRVAPAIIRLVFHDCFVQGCDASVLLDGTHKMKSEKDTPPNQSLKGFDHVDTIKSELETVCPGVVSCADLLVVAAVTASYWEFGGLSLITLGGLSLITQSQGMRWKYGSLYT